MPPELVSASEPRVSPEQRAASVQAERQPPATPWPWRVGFVIETPELVEDLSEALQEINAGVSMHAFPQTPSFETAGLVERQKPDLLFVELSKVDGNPAEWLNVVRSGGDTPIIVAIHVSPEPAEMISALRAGAGEFLFLPVKPGVFDALERVSTILESRQRAEVAPGRLMGFISAKGGCGATTLACHLAVALQNANPSSKALVLDLDYQSPGAHRVFRTSVRATATEAFGAVRRLNSSGWSEFATPVAPGVDLLPGAVGGLAEPPEPWRVDSLFRFIVRNYNWVLADLGRHLNPSNWAFLDNVEELFVVTAPDVLALYQTRSVLQMLTTRGFDRSRLRLVLNRNQSGPNDFWVESIQQMFELPVFAVVPGDAAALSRLPADKFEYPGSTNVGKAVTRLAGRILSSGKPGGPKPDSGRKAA